MQRRTRPARHAYGRPARRGLRATLRRPWVMILAAAGVLVPASLVAANTVATAATERARSADSTRAVPGEIPGPTVSAPGDPQRTPVVESTVTCVYTPADPGGAADRAMGRPPARPTRTGTVTAVARTNLGEIRMELDATAAPCTVNAFVHLVAGDFYSETPCHRLTRQELWILSCGDPSGTGTGTPGYQYDDENLPDIAAQVYSRGVLAMANAGAGTNGAQFFIVYRDSDLTPTYPVLGKVVSGMEIIDRIAAGGIVDDAPDGAPQQKVMIEEIAVG